MDASKHDTPAFPRFVPDGHYNGSIDYAGMSLRDWFAGQALPAVIAATSAGQHMPYRMEDEKGIVFAIARDAYEMADAMLTARGEQS